MDGCTVDYGIPLGAIDFNWVGRIACSRQCVSTSLNGEALTRRKTKKSVILWTGWGVRTSVRFVIHHFIFSRDRKSTRLNSSHVSISYAVFCLKKKKKHTATE